MGHEIDEGAAYLLALKQTGQPGGAAVSPAREVSTTDPAEQASAAPQDSDQFKGAEKRRSARYKCEGSAEVREEGCDVRTWAKFTDVSLHGCYVEAQATYPAGTILNLKLEANGLRVECMGTVRVNYPYLGMGISFQNMSEETKARLKQLLATLSRHCVIVGPGTASPLPAKGPLEAIPVIADPSSAMQALVEFFGSRQILMREDFLRLIKKSQNKR
jgi:hypothetical protein